MKTTLLSFAFLIASASAFALGDITAARSADNCPPGSAHSAALASASESRTVTIAEGSSLSIDGTLLSASATAHQPCDLIVFQNGESQLLQIASNGTSLNNLHVSGTVSASGNPFGYNCSLVLKYTTP